MKKRKLDKLLTQLCIDTIECTSMPFSIQMKLDTGKSLKKDELQLMNDKALAMLCKKNLVYKKIKKALK